MDDQALLNACPEFISVGGLLKATPATEGDARIMYFEASNEDVDHQNEIVLQKALTDSAEYFKRHGNIDLSHFTLLGPKQGIPDYMTYEIGKPVDVRVGGKSTFVKAELYRGDSPMAKNANLVWDSVTKQRPASRWYPSVGGAVLSKSIQFNPDTKSNVAVVDKVRWSNIALDRTPVNRTVPVASLVPIGTFAKSLNGFIFKTLTAGYGTDSVDLAGAAAMRKQSLDGATANYFDFRNKLAERMRDRSVGNNPGSAELVQYCAKNFGLSRDEAAEWVERFMRDIKTGLSRRSKS